VFAGGERLDGAALAVKGKASNMKEAKAARRAMVHSGKALPHDSWST
jgi:hypothetical protein